MSVVLNPFQIFVGKLLRFYQTNSVAQGTVRTVGVDPDNHTVYLKLDSTDARIFVLQSAWPTTYITDADFNSASILLNREHYLMIQQIAYFEVIT